MASRQPPWKRGNPKPKAARKTLTPTQKTAARRAAMEAGRRYPNLIDNMRAAAKKTTKVAKKKVAKKAVKRTNRKATRETAKAGAAPTAAKRRRAVIGKTAQGSAKKKIAAPGGRSTMRSAAKR